MLWFADYNLQQFSAVHVFLACTCCCLIIFKVTVWLGTGYRPSTTSTSTLLLSWGTESSNVNSYRDTVLTHETYDQKFSWNWSSVVSYVFSIHETSVKYKNWYLEFNIYWNISLIYSLSFPPCFTTGVQCWVICTQCESHVRPWEEMCCSGFLRCSLL